MHQNKHQNIYVSFTLPLSFVGIGANLFFIMTVSLLSWYHWSDSVWMEEAKKRLRNRAEESRRKRSEGISTDISTTTIDEKSFEDDEDISIIEEKPLSPEDDSDDIEELYALSETELRQRKSTAKSSEMASS